jgi:RNA polymerase sigma-70 factor (ECF subfamily)
MVWSGVMSAPDTRRVAAAIWRIEAPKLIAMLVRLVGRVDLAEEIAQEAFVEALSSWSTSGVPEKPGAWLMTAARRTALDALRHRRRAERKHEEVGRELETTVAPSFDESLDDIIGDDLLRLVFVACHPVLSPEARVALTLRLLGGLTTEEIAGAFLVPEPTIAQRITRAKRVLAQKSVPFELPGPEDLGPRLESVLEVVYLIFNEGYLATAGDDWMRPALCEDALRLGRVLAELLPEQSEVHGLLGLMQIQASRALARVGPSGEAVLLLEQDRSKWDQRLIQGGLSALARGEALAGRLSGPYLLQGAIAACHARASRAEDTDWPLIVAYYEALARVAPSPIVELNRAVAAGMAFGPEVALSILDSLRDDPALAQYPFLPSVRAEFLGKLGRHAEAREEVERAAALTKNAQERGLLLQRALAYARAQTATRG